MAELLLAEMLVIGCWVLAVGVLLERGRRGLGKRQQLLWGWVGGRRDAAG